MSRCYKTFLAMGKFEYESGDIKFKGDWIIKEPFPTGYRDFYPCKNDIFQSTYEAVL